MFLFWLRVSYRGLYALLNDSHAIFASNPITSWFGVIDFFEGGQYEFFYFFSINNEIEMKKQNKEQTVPVPLSSPPLALQN